MAPSTHKNGFVLVSLLLPTLGIVAAGTAIIWFVLSRWDTFSPGLQLGLKGVGGVAFLTLIGATAWESRKNGGQRRGF